MTHTFTAEWKKKTHMLSLKKTPGQNMNNHFNKYKIAHKHKGQFSRHRLSLLLKKNYGDSPPAPQFIPKLDLIHWETRLSRFPTPTTMVMILVRNPAWSGCSVSNQVLSLAACAYSHPSAYVVSHFRARQKHLRTCGKISHSLVCR